MHPEPLGVKKSSAPKRNVYYVHPDDLLNGPSLVDHARSKLLYNELAPLYELLTNRNTEREAKFLLKIIERYVPGKVRVLDIGCGVGRYVEHLGPRHDVVGIDISEEMVRLAERAHPASRFHKMDMRRIELESAFDVAICMWTTFNYLSKPEEVGAFLRGVHQHLKRNGILIIDMKNCELDPKSPRTRTTKNNKYELKLTVHKHRIGPCIEGIYIYSVKDLEVGDEWTAVDQELAMAYTLDDLSRFTQGYFGLRQTFGDYDIDEEYRPDTSDRLIMVLSKLEDANKL